MKTKLLLAASILALSTTAIAQPPAPSKCPSEDSLRSVGLDRKVIAQDRQTGQWVVGRMSNKYDTNDSWTFVVGQIDATGPEDAFERARRSLSSLNYQAGPVFIQRLNRWGCGYRTGAGYPAIAVTPDLKSGLTSIPGLLG